LGAEGRKKAERRRVVAQPLEADKTGKKKGCPSLSQQACRGEPRKRAEALNKKRGAMCLLQQLPGENGKGKKRSKRRAKKGRFPMRGRQKERLVFFRRKR